jgi:hypothetical protein
MRTEHPFVRGWHGGRRAAEVRSWTSWHRWTILALLACAFFPCWPPPSLTTATRATTS